MSVVGGSVVALQDWLAALRADDRRRGAVMLLGVVVGLGLGSVHWLGLAFGGALVALPSRTVPRGLLAGLGLGGLVLLVFAGLLALQGALAPALGSGLVGGIAVIMGLALPVFGALVRAVV